MTPRLLLFLLLASASARPVRFAILGDRTGAAQPGIYDSIVAEVQRAKPELVLTVGDQIEGYTEDTAALNREWEEYRGIVSRLSAPLYLTPGNHDITTEAQLGPFQTRNGPPYYSFDYKGLHLIVLDVSRWEAADKLPADQLQWLALDLARTPKDRLTFVFYHKPFWDGSTAEGRPDTLHRLFVRYGVDAVFTGHYHQYFSGTFDGIRYTVLGSSGGGTDPGPTGIEYMYTLVEVSGRDFTITPVLLGGEKREWDDVTVSDMRSIARNELVGLRFSAPVLAGRDLKARDRARLSITNPSPTEPLSDTLRWELPEGWSVSPAETVVAVAAGSSAELGFDVSNSGRLFPAPVVSLRMPYAPGRSTPVSRSLHVARVAEALHARTPPTRRDFFEGESWHDVVDVLLDADGGPARTDQTCFYFAYDSANLYLGAVCFEANVAAAVARATDRDGTVYGDDCVGWFLQPDTGKSAVYQVYVSRTGVVFDQKIAVNDRGEMSADPAWNHENVVRTGGGEPSHWSVEVAIPLTGDFPKARAGDVWGLNFRRKQPGGKANADWQPISYDPATFGLLKLMP